MVSQSDSFSPAWAHCAARPLPLSPLPVLTWRTGANTPAATGEPQVRQGAGGEDGQVHRGDQEIDQEGDGQIPHLPHLAQYATLPPPFFDLRVSAVSRATGLTAHLCLERTVLLGFVVFGGIIFEVLSRIFFGSR